MKNEKKYPCIVNKNAQNKYIGIMFNGDQGIYRKETVRALKKAGVQKELIKDVKKADGDLTISRILIKADLYDVLVNVFNCMDARTAILDYIDSLDEGVVNKFKSDLSDLEGDLSKMTSVLNKEPDLEFMLFAIDKRISDKCITACESLMTIHQEITKAVITKYQEACKRKLQRLNEEIQSIQEETEKLERLILKIK